MCDNTSLTCFNNQTSIISDDYGHTLGCYADVLAYIDGQCTGRNRCKVVIGTLDAVAQPCPKDFKSYLEASYLCVPGKIKFVFILF